MDNPSKDGHSPTLVLHENAHTIDFNWPAHHGSSGQLSGELHLPTQKSKNRKEVEPLIVVEIDSGHWLDQRHQR